MSFEEPPRKSGLLDIGLAEGLAGISVPPPPPSLTQSDTEETTDYARCDCCDEVFNYTEDGRVVCSSCVEDDTRCIGCYECGETLFEVGGEPALDDSAYCYSCFDAMTSRVAELEEALQELENNDEEDN